MQNCIHRSTFLRLQGRLASPHRLISIAPRCALLARSCIIITKVGRMYCTPSLQRLQCYCFCHESVSIPSNFLSASIVQSPMALLTPYPYSALCRLCLRSVFLSCRLPPLICPAGRIVTRLFVSVGHLVSSCPLQSAGNMLEMIIHGLH